MKVLLLGATGFLGQRLMKRLLKDQIEVIPVGRSLGIDLTDISQFRSVFETHPGIHTVLHAATFIGGIKFGLDHPAEIYYKNSLISAYLFELAHQFGVKRIINPISNCSYPRDIFPEFKEELWWNGPLDESVAVYGLVRKASYVQSWAYYKQYGLETINLIVPNMYGPGDHFDEVRSHALGALIKKIHVAKRRGDPEVQVWGSGKPVREWLYIDDCVEAINRAMTIAHHPEPINIGVGSGVSIGELAQLIKIELGYEGQLRFDTTKPDGAPYKVMNIDRSKRVLNWTAQTDLNTGIHITAEWYLQHCAEPARTDSVNTTT